MGSCTHRGSVSQSKPARENRPLPFPRRILILCYQLRIPRLQLKSGALRSRYSASGTRCRHIPPSIECIMLAQARTPAFLRSISGLLLLALLGQSLPSHACHCAEKPAETGCCNRDSSDSTHPALATQCVTAKNCDCCRQGKCAARAGAPLPFDARPLHDADSDADCRLTAPGPEYDAAPRFVRGAISAPASVCSSLQRCILFSRFTL